MAFISIDNVKIKGLSACVPSTIEENANLKLFKAGEAERIISSTGIARKRVVETGVTTSDLCVKAAEKLITDLGWDRGTIDCLVFVSSSRDYITPPTSCILQDRLQLKEECYAIDIPCGCPGWLYGLNVISSLLSHGDMKRGLLLVGDTSTTLNSPKDKETRPLFGDAGTVTALEFTPGAEQLNFMFATDGKSYDAIITRDGGSRNPVTEESLKEIEYGPNIVRRGVDCKIDGMAVFIFGLSKVPSCVKALMEHYNIIDEEVDLYLFHQANRYMNEKIRKKLKIDERKVPYSLTDFGNTSCASIPLTAVTQSRQLLIEKDNTIIACAFGVGLSWGSCKLNIDKIVCPELIEY